MDEWIFIKHFLILRHPRVISGTVLPALMIYREKCLGIFTPTCFIFLKLAGSEPNLCCDVLPCYRIIGGIYNFCPQTCKMHNIIEIIFLTLRVLVES